VSDLKRNPKKIKTRIIISQIKLSQFNNVVNKYLKICKEFIAKNITSSKIWSWNIMLIYGECHKIKNYLFFIFKKSFKKDFKAFIFKTLVFLSYI